MNRRKFIRKVAEGSAALAIGLSARSMFAQQPPYPQYPVDCSPPAHGAPKPIKFDTYAAIQPRKSVWDLSSGEIDRLRAAYQALRDLTTKDPNDPRGWMQTANVHCYNCSGGFDPSNVEIHGSWWFMPWHRCYLHVHERILAKLIGDPTFRLAYWDWDTYPSHANFPPPFYPPNQSLFDVYRGITNTAVLPRRITGPAHMSIVLGTQSTDAFMGQLSNPPQNEYYPGVLESSPHGPVHIWCGYPGQPGAPNEPVGCFYPNNPGGQPVDQSSNGCMDMGVLASAARDPVFFAHHSNIDRLWDVWNGMPGSQGDPTASSWSSQQFNFYDENGEWISIAISDVTGTKEQTNLRYTYQPPQTTVAPMMLASAEPAARARRATGVQKIAPLMVDGDNATTDVGTAPHARSVAIPQSHQTNLRRFAAARGTARRKYFLHIDGFTLPPNESAIVDVFVGDVDVTKATEQDAEFVGTWSVVASGRGHNHDVVRNAVFEIRPATAAILADQTDLKVTLVPTSVSGAPPVASNLKYKKIYLTVE